METNSEDIFRSLCFGFNFSIPFSAPRGRGYSQKDWMGLFGLLCETLTLFQTKICDFPNPI